jgi:hypothetical protein
MKRIYKYPFEINDIVEMNLPKGAEVLSVQCQDDVPCLWALVDPEAKLLKRTFKLFGTGHDIDEAPQDHLSYIATFQQHDGLLVWHIFEHNG